MPSKAAFTVKKLIAMTQDTAERIAAYRFEQRIGSESEAIRRLIEAGLKAATPSKHRGVKTQRKAML